MRRAHDVPDPGREPAGARAAQSAQSSLLHQARAGGHGAQPDLVLGHHPAPGAQTLDVLLPLCLARHLQPLRRGLDGCRSGERRARRDADRGNLSQARHRAPGAHPAFGPRRADDQQVHRPTPRRPRGHPLSEPPPGQRRQPLLRGAVQDPECPTRNEFSVLKLLPTYGSGAERWRGRAMPRRWRWLFRSPWPDAGCG